MAQQVRRTSLGLRQGLGWGWGRAGSSLCQLEPQRVHVCLHDNHLGSAVFCLLLCLHLLCLQQGCDKMQCCTRIEIISSFLSFIRAFLHPSNHSFTTSASQDQLCTEANECPQAYLSWMVLNHLKASPRANGLYAQKTSWLQLPLCSLLLSLAGCSAARCSAKGSSAKTHANL